MFKILFSNQEKQFISNLEFNELFCKKLRNNFSLCQWNGALKDHKVSFINPFSIDWYFLVYTRMVEMSLWVPTMSKSDFINALKRCAKRYPTDSFNRPSNFPYDLRFWVNVYPELSDVLLDFFLEINIAYEMN